MDPLSATFAALADPTRRAILVRLKSGPATINELAGPFEMTLPSVSRHIKVLESAGLVSKSRDAQFRSCRLEAPAMQAAAGWLATYEDFFNAGLDRLESQLKTMMADRADKPEQGDK